MYSIIGRIVYLSCELIVHDVYFVSKWRVASGGGCTAGTVQCSLAAAEGRSTAKWIQVPGNRRTQVPARDDLMGNWSVLYIVYCIL